MTTTALPRSNAELKALASSLGLPLRSLFVLDPSNDPYAHDTPANHRDAAWFTGIWQRAGFTSGVHVRRVHYFAMSQETYLPSGERYVNTEQYDAKLGRASSVARDLGYIDPQLFDDRRNPGAAVHVEPRGMPPTPAVEFWTPRWEVPHVDLDRFDVAHFDLGGPLVDGYDYVPDDQPVLLELWCEKSTMDDVLAPLAARFGANFTAGKGFTSHTQVIAMLRRAARHGKPLRIFAISDYDPAGAAMPIALARRIEFYRDEYAPGVDVAIAHIGMTAEWVKHYALPRVPIKDNDRRRANFEERHGEGAVELDALEALYPGALAAEVRAALEPYVDPSLRRRLGEAEAAAWAQARQAWAEATEPQRARVEDLERAVRAIVERWRPTFEAFNEELSGVQAELDAVHAELVALAGTVDAALPPRPQPATAEVDETAWLFRSARSWLEQLLAYRTEQRQEAEAERLRALLAVDAAGGVA